MQLKNFKKKQNIFDQMRENTTIRYMSAIILILVALVLILIDIILTKMK